jgi:hypothetical protein
LTFFAKNGREPYVKFVPESLKEENEKKYHENMLQKILSWFVSEDENKWSESDEMEDSFGSSALA